MTTDSHAKPAASAKHERRHGSLVFPNLVQLAEDRDNLDWKPFFPGVDIRWLHREGDHGPSAALIRFQPGASVPTHEHRGIEHIFVLSGSQSDENGRLETGGLMVHRPGTRHSIASEEGCLVLAIYEKPALFGVGDGGVVA